MTTSSLEKDSMIMLSFCDPFWNAMREGKEAKIAIVSENHTMTPITKERAIELFTNKKVLALLHGFNNNETTIIPNYFAYSKRATSQIHQEVTLGIVWPSFSGRAFYPFAKRRTLHLGKKLHEALKILFSSCAKVDFLAHSMGARLVCESLKIAKLSCVRHLFFLAPALDCDAFEENQSYSTVPEKCEKIVICYSKNDTLLRIGYPIAELSLRTSLGYWGPSRVNALSKNVIVVDATDVIDHHNAYTHADKLYEGISKVIEITHSHSKVLFNGSLEKYSDNALFSKKLTLLSPSFYPKYSAFLLLFVFSLFLAQSWNMTYSSATSD